MLAQIVEPTEELVDNACTEFDNDNKVVEGTLSRLFLLNPLNEDIHAVLAKAAILNDLYSTNIYVYPTKVPGIIDIAEHIAKHGKEIDAGLAVGSDEVVSLIARIELPEKTPRTNYSFATKYCSWHNPDKYPIWDSRVDHYLWSLQREKPFSNEFNDGYALRDYAMFRRTLDAFAERYSLANFKYKAIDKFLWKYGGD
jgi:hypothetical protein